MDRIEELLDGLIAREGGYSDHPADRGGPTNYGITLAVARSEGFGGAMRDLPRALARDIYRRRYWLTPRFDRVAEIAPKIAAELFDTGVNMGPAVATGILQRTLNALNRQQEDWPDIVVDRRIGPATLNSLRAFLRKRGARGNNLLLKAMNALQGERYVALAESRPENEAFLFGWLDNRID